MKPTYVRGNVSARCPDCEGAVTTFERKLSGHEFGSVTVPGTHVIGESRYTQILYVLMRCAACGRGGLAKIHSGGPGADLLECFFPVCIDRATIPDNVPVGIVSEYREAEICASVQAWRAASALLRSALEKTLKENGYNSGSSLAAKIDEAATDGIITESRRNRAHEDIRVLGNDVLHDPWRKVEDDEFDLAHHYVQRILEDFYDDRDLVEKQLNAKGKLKKTSP